MEANINHIHIQQSSAITLTSETSIVDNSLLWTLPRKKEVEMQELNDFINEEQEILFKELVEADRREAILLERIKELEVRVEDLKRKQECKPIDTLSLGQNLIFVNDSKGELSEEFPTRIQ